MRTPIVLLPSVLLGSGYLAPLAAALRRLDARVHTAELTGARTPAQVAERYRAATDLAADTGVTWVAHSNAGCYLPALLTGRPADAGVFVDASVPPEDAPNVSAAGPRLAALRQLAGADGVLPAWPDWWGAEQLAALLPDAGHRRLIRATSPRLPLAYFGTEIDVPAGWRAARTGYLSFDGGYEPVAARAAAAGWPTAHLGGGHLTVLSDPAAVAGAVLRLAAALRRP